MADTLLREWGPRDVLTLTLNRPERRNALDPELLAALAAALQADGERAGAVILRGAGSEAFSAGYDLSRLTGTAADLDADGVIGEAASALRQCPSPVIARLQGHCHGAAVELALNCDLRIASPAPKPRIARPWEISATAAIALAVTVGCRVTAFVTPVPRPIRDVFSAATTRPA